MKLKVRKEIKSESYCLKMLKHIGKKKQWIDGKGLKNIETVLILKVNIFSQSDVYMWEKAVNK